MQVLQRKVRGASVIRKGQNMLYTSFFFPIITAHIVSAHVTLNQHSDTTLLVQLDILRFPICRLISEL